MTQHVKLGAAWPGLLRRVCFVVLVEMATIALEESAVR
jgi:hypothetical protein